MPVASSLINLASRYERAGGHATLDKLRALANEYIQKRTESILDAAAIAIAFDYVFASDRVDLSQITPDMARAWELAYPHVPIESLAGRSTEELAGIISGWKGKLFEVEVERRLNAGEWVGDLHLEHDQVAVLADSPIQPGWDMQILSPDGDVVDSIQLKAAESVSYIHEALARYPDTPVFATHEVAARMVSDGVIDSGVLNEHLTDGVSAHISDATSDTMADSLMVALPISIIAATEAIKVMAGKKSVDEAFTSGGDRLVKGAIASGVAVAVSFVGTPILGAIAGFITRLALGSEDATTKSAPVFIPPNSLRMQEEVRQLTLSARPIRRHYPCEYKSDIGTGKPNLSDDEEMRRMADDTTRLQIEQGSMPLASWIRMMTRKDMEAMTEVDFRRHLSDLRRINKQGWVRRAFPASGIIDVFARAFDDEYQQLSTDLNQALRIGWILERKYAGTFTEADKEALMLAKMTGDERRKYERNKYDRASVESFLRKHPGSIDIAREHYPNQFNPDGTLRS
jgi:hypothetical protein